MTFTSFVLVLAFVLTSPRQCGISNRMETTPINPRFDRDATRESSASDFVTIIQRLDKARRELRAKVILLRHGQLCHAFVGEVLASGTWDNCDPDTIQYTVSIWQNFWYDVLNP